MKFILILMALLDFTLSPIALAATSPGPVCEANWVDAARTRTVPVRIRMPEGSGKVPVILFSHGLGGSVDSGTLWAEAWATVGFAVINIQHPGSDRGILRGGALRAAMSPQQLVARVKDVHFVIDELGRRPREGACNLTRLDLSKIGISGHSFGAHTTQAVAGQHFPMASAGGYTDRRVKAAIAFSPSPPFRGSAEAAFADVRIPFFSITGTEDSVPLTPQIAPADREQPFRAMPPGGKYLLVLDGASHMDFNGRGDGRPAPDDHIQAVVVDATIAFWRWALLGDEAAKHRLDTADVGLASSDRLDHH
jgi:predicted dienelactone hydrolase